MSPVYENSRIKIEFSIDREHSHFVIEPKGNTTIFDITTLQAICDLEKRLTSTPSYTKVCDTETYSKKCCRPWSISNYILLLSNKTDCAEIQVKSIIPEVLLLNMPVI